MRWVMLLFTASVFIEGKGKEGAVSVTPLEIPFGSLLEEPYTTGLVLLFSFKQLTPLSTALFPLCMVLHSFICTSPPHTYCFAFGCSSQFPFACI